MPEQVEGTEEEIVETEALDVEDDTDKPTLTDEDKDKLIEKLRRENASRRVKSKEEQAELEAFRAWKESQMSEAEKLQARLKEAEDRLATATKKAVLAEYGLDQDLADFVFGTEDEMVERAKVLAEKTRRTTSRHEGDRKPVAQKKDRDGGDLLQFLAVRDLGGF